MKNRWNKTAIIILFAVLVMTLGAVAAFAQDDETPEAPPLPALPFDRHGYHGGHHWEGDQDFYQHHGFHGRFDFRGARGAGDEALAEALGITVEDLQAAHQKVAADRIAQAVEDGILTLDQANTLLAMQALKGYLDREALLAEALGITVEELQAAREEGTLYDLLADITPADLQEKMQTVVETAVQQAVTDNVITQEQADLVLERVQNGLELHQNFGGHRGFGRHGGFRGFHGAPFSDDDSETFAPFRTMRNAPQFNS